MEPNNRLIRINALGSANLLERSNNNGFKYSYIGEKGYFPPEVISRLTYRKNGEPYYQNVKFVNDKADVFILGLILFNMVTGGEMPFEEAIEENGKYKWFVKEK